MCSISSAIFIFIGIIISEIKIPIPDEIRIHNVNDIPKGMYICNSEFLLFILSETDITVLSDCQYDIIKYSDFIWACSGTVTLETAILKKPMIIVYKSSRFNFYIAMLLSKLRMVGLPNIINGDNIAIPTNEYDNIISKNKENSSN